MSSSSPAKSLLNKTFSSGNQTLWTWSAWVKRSILGSFQVLFGNQLDGGTIGYLAFDSNDKLDLNKRVDAFIGQRFTKPNPSS